MTAISKKEATKVAQAVYQQVAICQDYINQRLLDEYMSGVTVTIQYKQLEEHLEEKLFPKTIIHVIKSYQDEDKGWRVKNCDNTDEANPGQDYKQWLEFS